MPIRLTTPIISLTSDFGLSDHYVGTMKAVILSRCPGASIVDITHDVPSFSVLAGAHAISQAAPFFPAGSIHVVVVDPGVGTSRKAIFAEIGDQMFIAPDNGVLTLVLKRDKNAIVREITNNSLCLESPSNTFHGRDIFSPVAASIGAGKAQPEDVGPIIDSPELLAEIYPRQLQAGAWHGIVLSIDHFGNVITNLPFQASSKGFTLQLKGVSINAIHKTFGEAPANAPFAYHGSSGYIEIGVNQKSAAGALQVQPGDWVTLLYNEALQS
jgi:S-adenosyl-L-methionine hydrolase (adenosine-forming)